ncbi:hypothetical protein B0T24DRAFT_686822 [Lasiosphaeria ovina]|uniref:Protein kinase domain-containing protein n=1 Tax=Lasiosphaeria ovina TaxID=92902 RepID=A0AAE0NJL9_9PEZI|nr:hypothetical protein B0T24DRAFT_686822 [Lasiosphaeria ovina]
MSSLIYPSAFGAEDQTSTTADSTVTAESKAVVTPTPSSAPPTVQLTDGLAALLCHASFVGEGLRRYDGQQSTFSNPQHRGRIVQKSRIGAGLSFIVHRATLEASDGPGKTVVIKTVRDGQTRQGQWQDVLLEIRALMHKPIHYHPNIVRLLDIRWDSSTDTGSPFPALVQEFAAFGTLDKIQKNLRPLPFSIKQKLCYDVGRGLSIIHACGMVHGDLKHENVLIFANRYTEPSNQPFTAKLADFGGTVMDMSRDGTGTHRVRMHTFPYEAPEIGDNLSPDGVKKTDAFSYGMLIWRCMIDCKDIPSEIYFKTIGWEEGAVPTERHREKMRWLKISDGLLDAATHNLAAYFFSNHLPGHSFCLVTAALRYTLRGDPAHRALDRALARMRGLDAVEAHLYADIKDKANASILDDAEHERGLPGQQRIDLDRTGFMIGSMGDDYDAQINLPGFRPDLPHPPAMQFSFKPHSLKRFLDWGQQKQVVDEFEAASKFNGPPQDSGSSFVPSKASYFLFESYLCGFGVLISPQKACYWLHRAAEYSYRHSLSATTDILSHAWVCRVHEAFGVQNPDPEETQFKRYLYWGIERGFRHCIDEAKGLIETSNADDATKSEWNRLSRNAMASYRMGTSSTGMLLFRAPQLLGNWTVKHMEDPELLEAEIKKILGPSYDSCLRINAPAERPPDDPAISLRGEGQNRFDRIYVNKWGHGLLHMAASFGRLDMLKNLYGKYNCDLNLQAQRTRDTPLVCACRSAWLDCVLYCLEKGADPNGHEYTGDPPLHCISSFGSEGEMEEVVSKLVYAGADLEKSSDRKQGLYVADWDETLGLKVTPLGRAVLMQSLPAVRVLLRHGANPLEKRPEIAIWLSPIELAAILTLPDILEELLVALDRTNPEQDILDECAMLEMARVEKLAKFDVLSMQSRVIRCGAHYKDWLRRTMVILSARSQRLSKTSPTPAGRQRHPLGRQMCEEIRLGNIEIVEILLDLGHSVEGSPGCRPIEVAVLENSVEIFQLLTSRGSPLSVPDHTSSLLGALASRPRWTPSDSSVIAEYLLDKTDGPFDPLDQPSPLAWAIGSGYYDLADLLISRGAGQSLNCLHSRAGGASDIYSLLGLMTEQHKPANLRGVKYLAALHNRKDSMIRLSPLAISSFNGIGISVVHTLAANMSGKWSSHGQISASILQSVLEMFPDPPSLGDLYVHQGATTPLGFAVITGHMEAFNLLMASEYRRGWNETMYMSQVDTSAPPAAMKPQQQKQADGAAESDGETGMTASPSPASEVPPSLAINLVHLAIRVAAQGVEKLQSLDTISPDDLAALKQRVHMAKTLFWLRLSELSSFPDLDTTPPPRDGFVVSDGSETSKWTPDAFDSALSSLARKLRESKLPHIDYDADGAEDIVDLSVLTEEHPTPTDRPDGQGMDDKTAMRHFLHELRRGGSIFGGDPNIKRMNELFNSRGSAVLASSQTKCGSSTTRKLRIVEFADNAIRPIPSYSILSHTWGDQEITYHDIVSLSSGNRNLSAVFNLDSEVKSKTGFAKVKNAAALAVKDGFAYMWIDTCCIDKASSAELSEAINSMYRCRAREELPSAANSTFRRSRWFTRGWTLQELLAPKEVRFFASDWSYLGSQSQTASKSARPNIPPSPNNISKNLFTEITSIDQRVLQGTLEPRQVSVAARMSWAASRETTRPEDIAYCLLGVFSLFLKPVGKTHYHNILDCSVRSWLGAVENIPPLSSSASGVINHYTRIRSNVLVMVKLPSSESSASEARGKYQAIYVQRQPIWILPEFSYDGVSTGDGIRYQTRDQYMLVHVYPPERSDPLAMALQSGRSRLGMVMGVFGFSMPTSSGEQRVAVIVTLRSTDAAYEADHILET